MVLDAIEMSRWSRGKTLAGLRCHSDASSQFTSIRYGERLAEIGAVPSIGTVGDSYDNALAETANGYYKTELIYGPARTGPWKSVEDVELATLGWVHWHNTSRPHGYLHTSRRQSSNCYTNLPTRGLKPRIATPRNPGQISCRSTNRTTMPQSPAPRRTDRFAVIDCTAPLTNRTPNFL